MTYEQKADESLEASEILRENKKYNSCVNRAYYSLYQRMLFKLDCVKLLDKVNQECRNQKGNHVKGSHEFTIDYFLNTCVSARAKKPRVNSCAYNLKRLRHKADYLEDEISELDVKDAIQLTKLFKDLVK